MPLAFLFVCEVFGVFPFPDNPNCFPVACRVVLCWGVERFVREGDGASGWDGDEEEKDGLPVRLLSPSRDRRMNMYVILY